MGDSVAQEMPDTGANKTNNSADLYCPACQKAVADPLVCGDCSSVICRVCGTPLERIDELGIG
jgi:methionyl-tRNA synthetase